MSKLFAAVSTAALLIAGGAQAVTIFSASSASTSAGVISPYGHVDAAISQDSFVTPFVSGVTDFETFVASTNSGSGGLAAFAGFASPYPVDVDFSFDDALTLEKFALWNQSGSATLDAFELYGSASGDFSDAALLGSYNAASGYQGQTFTFGAVDVLGIRLRMLSNEGYSAGVVFTEAAFGGELAAVAPVPLPAGGLLMLGGLGMLALRRKR
jgi:hypothetical protein